MNEFKSNVELEGDPTACLSDPSIRLNWVLEATSDSVMTISHLWVVSYANSRALKSFPNLQIGAEYWNAFQSC